LIVVSKIMNLSKRFVDIESVWVLPVVLFATAAAIATGVLFYRFIEAPLEKWRKGAAMGRREAIGRRHEATGKRPEL
jgi:peptidoglycan/LPS O-acetylase OafA/YrhL